MAVASNKSSFFEHSLFYLLIIFLPTQFGRHFWPDYTFSGGVRIDYFSPTIYFTDLLIICLAGISFNRIILNKLIPFISNHKYYFLGLLFLISVNIYYSLVPQVSVYYWMKFLEILFLAFWVKENQSNTILKKLAIIFSFQMILLACIVSVEFISQSSIGGILYFLGERNLTTGTIGVADAVINGRLFLRPYGTFSHPNILAGYSLIIFIYMLSVLKSFRKTGKFIFLLFGLAGTVAVIFLSLSRLSIFITTITILYALFSLKKELFSGNNLKLLIVSVCIITMVIFSRYLNLFDRFISLQNIDSSSYVSRLSIDRFALKIFFQNIFTGTGLGTFPRLVTGQIVNKNYFLLFQPVHNIFLLTAAETGLGLIMYLAGFLITVWTRLSSPGKHWQKILFTTILFLGLFDHYWYTSQQGILVIALILGLFFRQDRRAKIN